MDKQMKSMFLSLKSLKKSKILASDGEIGHVEEFLFDDEKWTVRYLVVNTGSWLTGRKVLVSPISVQEIDDPANTIRVSLTRQQVEASPDIDSDKPVSRQNEAQYYDYYRWPYYWEGGGIWGGSPYPGMLGGQYRFPTSPPKVPPEKRDSHLRSTHIVQGYEIEATDHLFGRVEDFIIDDATWSIRYLVIDTVRFWPNKSVILSPEWVDSISWEERRIRVNLTEDKIKNSVEYNPDAPVNREYEERLYDYYGRPKYWDSDNSPGFQQAMRRPGRFVL
jgi:sporulation protein YlmC with PRC-barrel domain